MTRYLCENTIHLQTNRYNEEHKFLAVDVLEDWTLEMGGHSRPHPTTLHKLELLL